MAIGTAQIYRTKNREFLLFLCFFSWIFRRSDDFLANFRDNYWVVGDHIAMLASLLMLVLLLQVSLLLLMLWCSYCLSCCGLLHAVAGFTVFARIPAFYSVHTVWAVLLLLTFLLLLAFLLWWAVMILSPLSSWWFPAAGHSCIADFPGVTIGVVSVSAVPFEHAVAGGPAVTDFRLLNMFLLLLASLQILVSIF